MTSRFRKSGKKNIRNGNWKLYDDYTGGPLYSNNIEIDYYGYLTERGKADIFHPQLLPPPTVIEASPTVTRPKPSTLQYTDSVPADVDTLAERAADDNWDFG